MGADDCMRAPGLKCLLLRKVGKANLEHFEDLRQACSKSWRMSFGLSGCARVCQQLKIAHFQTESDIDSTSGWNMTSSG
jgi:hypothetical protein